MSQIYTTRRRALRDAGKAAAPARGTRQEAYFGRGASETGEGMGSQLGELMQARMRQHFLDHQNPAAEREADQLSAGLDNARTPEEVKSRLGERLGADFSGVRFHTGSGAVSAAEQIGARAYATGRDVYFGEGGFDPSVAAHELVHTVQQGLVESSTPTVSAPAGGVQMWPWSKKSKKLSISAPALGRTMTPEEIRGGLWTPEEAEQERQKIAESRKGLKEKLSDKAYGFFSNHFSNEKTQAAAAAYDNFNVADDVSQKLAGKQAGKARTFFTKVGSHAKKFGLGVKKHFMGAVNAGVNQEGDLLDRIGAAGLHTVNEAKDYVSGTDLGKNLKNKGILGTAKHYIGRAKEAAKNSETLQKIQNSAFYQKASALGQKIGESKFGKWVGGKMSAVKDAVADKYASYMRRHEDAVADIASSKDQIKQMTPFQKLKFMAKNPLAYLDAHTKGGKNRAMKKRGADQEADDLAERMRGMSLEDMQVTELDNASDMQDLFREEEDEPQTEAAPSGDFDENFGQDMRALFRERGAVSSGAGEFDENFGKDMRALFGEKEAPKPGTGDFDENFGSDMRSLFGQRGLRGANGDFDENFGTDMQDMFDPERMIREERENADFEYEGEGEDSLLGEGIVDFGLKVGDKLTGNAFSKTLSLKDKAKGIFQFGKNKWKERKIGKAMETEEDPEVKKILGYVRNTRGVRAKRGMEKTLKNVVKDITGIDASESAVEPTMAAIGQDSESAQKQARMALIDPNYQKYYEYALSELVHPDEYQKMGRVARNQVEHQAKHAALQTIYGKGVTTRKAAAAIEADRKARAASELASSNPEAKKKLMETADFSEDKVKGGFDERSALKKFNADFHGETFAEKQEQIRSRQYQKKHVTDAYIKDSQAQGDGFFKTMWKSLKKKLF